MLPAHCPWALFRPLQPGLVGIRLRPGARDQAFEIDQALARFALPAIQLLDLAIDRKLRGCDVVAIRIGDVVGGGKVKARAMVVQKKTGRPVQFELTEPARNSLTNWPERRVGTLADFAFPSRVNPEGHLSTRQYARLVDEWNKAIGLRPEDYGTHSLRRTKPSIIYKRTGNLRAVQMLLGHTMIETTARYLGVDMEDALSLAEATEI
jgi:integrase